MGASFAALGLLVLGPAGAAKAADIAAAGKAADDKSQYTLFNPTPNRLLRETEQLSTYYEVAARTGTHDPHGDIVIVATGFTYQFAKNLQADADVNIGVSAAADSVNPFLGFSARF